MLAVFPFCNKDSHLLIPLLQYIKELGGCSIHDALIVSDAGVPWQTCEKVAKLAQQSFAHVTLTANESSVDGWVAGGNSLWIAAATFCHVNKIQPWLLVEPDSVPLRASWLDEFQKAYKGGILACIYPHQKTGRQMVSGIACYPSTMIEKLGGGKVQLATNFDVALSENYVTSGMAVHTPLIQHVWGEDGLPPTFSDKRTPQSPRNTLTLEDIKPEAAVFHRCKNMSLLNLLRVKHGFARHEQGNPLMLVLPVCNKDADLMLKNVEWMFELDGKSPFDALLSYDHSLDNGWIVRLRAAAEKAFSKVHLFVYPTPPATNWPAGPNWAFQRVAFHMKTVNRPWLFNEADACPLKAGWLSTIQEEYLNCGKPIMGNIVPGMGHMNGAGIYPANFPELSPIAMSATDTAWDYLMKPDMIHLVHDSSHIMCHVWGLVDGQFHPSAGAAPHFAHVEIVRRLIKPQWVWLHRSKENSLRDRLREIRAGK